MISVMRFVFSDVDEMITYLISILTLELGWDCVRWMKGEMDKLKENCFQLVFELSGCVVRWGHVWWPRLCHVWWQRPFFRMCGPMRSCVVAEALSCVVAELF